MLLRVSQKLKGSQVPDPGKLSPFPAVLASAVELGNESGGSSPTLRFAAIQGHALPSKPQEVNSARTSPH